MEPSVADRVRLPMRQAFVVQLTVETDVARGHWVGRIEHVVSGDAQHFQTLEALLGFMARVLTGGDRSPRPAPGGP